MEIASNIHQHNWIIITNYIFSKSQQQWKKIVGSQWNWWSGWFSQNRFTGAVGEHQKRFLIKLKWISVAANEIMIFLRANLITFSTNREWKLRQQLFFIYATNEIILSKAASWRAKWPPDFVDATEWNR